MTITAILVTIVGIISIAYLVWTGYQSRYGGKINPDESDPLKRWAQAIYCIYTGDFDYAKKPHDFVNPTLVQSWHIRKRNDLIVALEELAQAANPYPAWDYVRFLNLARMGVAVRHLSDSESWSRIKPICQLLQANYQNWEHVGEDYLRGRREWLDLDVNGSQDNSDPTGEMPRILANIAQLRSSLWSTTRFDLSF
jgi:hypothetical protein